MLEHGFFSGHHFQRWILICKLLYSIRELSGMGCGMGLIFNRKLEVDPKNDVRAIKNFEDENYDLDVIEVSNLALAIKNEQPTINIEISLGCESLPEVDLFGLTDPMIVCFKKEASPAKEGGFVLTEIGRTEIIPNELNPRFIKTFILSYNEQRIDYIEFHIFDIDKFKSQDLRQHNLIGTVQTNVRQIVQAGTLLKEIDEKIRRKGKSYLKITSAEYDGGNSKYQITLVANNIAIKHDIFLKLEVYQFAQWVPIYCSEVQDNCKEVRFDEFELPTNKFPEEDKNRVRVKVFEFNDSKGQIQIGSTQQLIVNSLFQKGNSSKPPTIPVFKDSLPVGNITVMKFQKIIRDSFISYIINGAKLHLLVAIDFTKPLNEENPHAFFKRGEEQMNMYIEAMREVIGVLQYFDYYNQMAFYGFGAKLPPFYKTVGQCFALNQDFFKPMVVGGVQKLIEVYKQNLQQLILHGPTKLTELMDLAIEFAQAQPQSSDYYVLTVFTHSQVSDMQEVQTRIAKASQYPLSILLIGVGNSDFSQYKSIDSNDPFFKEDVKRDILHFIHFSKFMNGGGKSIIREIFAEIPKQFIEYMKIKGTKPSRKNKKSSKNDKTEFINKKINERRANRVSEPPYVLYIPKFLEDKKKKLQQKLIELGFDKTPLMNQMKIRVNSVNYYIQVESEQKTPRSEPLKNFKEVCYIQEVNKLDEIIERKERIHHKKTLKKLQKTEINQYGRKLVRVQPKIQQQTPKKYTLFNPCINCGEREIEIIYMRCGHACCCEQCEESYCQICNMESTGALLLS